MVGVGAWARVQYRSIHDEIHSSQPIQYGTLDQYFYVDEKAITEFTRDSCSLNVDAVDRAIYRPRQSTASGVKSNPFLD